MHEGGTGERVERLVRARTRAPCGRSPTGSDPCRRPGSLRSRRQGAHGRRPRRYPWTACSAPESSTSIRPPGLFASEGGLRGVLVRVSVVAHRMRVGVFRGHRAGADGPTIRPVVVPAIDGSPVRRFVRRRCRVVVRPSCAPSSPPWAWPRALGDTIAAVASASTHSGITTQTATPDSARPSAAAVGIASASAAQGHDRDFEHRCRDVDESGFVHIALLRPERHADRAGPRPRCDEHQIRHTRDDERHLRRSNHEGEGKSDLEPPGEREHDALGQPFAGMRCGHGQVDGPGPERTDARTTRIGTPGSFGRFDVPSGADESTAAAVRARQRWVRVDDMDSPCFDERALRVEDDLACSDPF